MKVSYSLDFFSEHAMCVLDLLCIYHSLDTVQDKSSFNWKKKQQQKNIQSFLLLLAAALQRLNIT